MSDFYKVYSPEAYYFYIMKNLLFITMLVTIVQVANGQAIKGVKTMENEMKSLSPNLMVSDVNQTLDFYIDKLGFRKIMTVPDSAIMSGQWCNQGQ
jgi:hypothetical protein